MTIVRAPRPDGNFTVIRNEVLRDDRLSYRARGLLAAILSRPDNWRTDSAALARDGKEGREAIRTALRELEEHGYLSRRKEQNPATGHWSTVAVVFDSAGDGFPGVGQPGVGQPAAGSPGANRSKTVKNNREESISPARSAAGPEPLTLAIAEDSGEDRFTARTVAAHWVDTYRATHDDEPAQQSIKRVAQAAKQLIDEGRLPHLILAAAADAASGGHANLASAYTFIVAKNKQTGRQAEPRGFDGIRQFLEASREA